MRRGSAVLVLALGACGRPDGSGVRPTGSGTVSAASDAPIASADAGPAGDQPQVFESWWGESPMGLKYAVAETDTADRISFVLAGEPLTCAVFEDSSLRKGTTDLAIAHLYEPDGTWKWMVARLGSVRASLSTATVRGSTDAGATIEVTVDVDLGARSEEPLAVKGTIAATVCARRDIVTDTVTGTRHSTASLTLAGQRFPIAGARVTSDRVELSTERGGRCFYGAERVLLTQWTSGPSAGKWGVAGTWLDRFAFITASGPTVTVGGERTIDGKAVRDLTLAGAGQIGPWSVAIDGTIEADVCAY